MWRRIRIVVLTGCLGLLLATWWLYYGPARVSRLQAEPKAVPDARVDTSLSEPAS